MRLMSILIVMACVFLAGCGKSDPNTPEQASQENAEVVTETLIYYTCPMESHKHVHSSQPGKCTECPMDLVKAVTTSKENMEFYGCPMEAHSHIRGPEPGKCTECGMDLKPMRLVTKEQ